VDFIFMFDERGNEFLEDNQPAGEPEHSPLSQLEPGVRTESKVD
jgi:hypothetical protein